MGRGRAVVEAKVTTVVVVLVVLVVLLLLVVLVVLVVLVSVPTVLFTFRFFFKVDDDIWLNTRALLATFNSHAQSLLNSVGGSCSMSHSVIRDPHAKWCVVLKALADRPNEPYGFCGRKAKLNHAHALVSVCP